MTTGPKPDSGIDSLVIVTSSYVYIPEDAHINSGVFVRDFARAIAEQGVAVTVVTQQRTTPVCRDPGIEVMAYPWSGMDRQPVELTVRSLTDLGHILSLLKEGKHAIRSLSLTGGRTRCLCMWAVPAGYMAMQALRKRNMPYDVWCLGSDIWHYGRKPYSRWLVKKILGKAQHLFADGYALREEVGRLSGCSCSFLASSRFLPEESPVIPQLVPGKPNFLYIGRWHPNKGVDLLPEMMRHLRQMGVEAHLHLFGGGMLQGELVREIARNNVGDCVTVHGYADSHTAAAYLRACDLLIIPSRIESIPIIFSDAARCGIPIVTTEVGDLGLLVREHLIGEVVRPGSSPDLAQGVRLVLQKGKGPFVAGLQRVKQIFDVKASAAEYIRIVTSESLNIEQKDG